MLILTTFDLDEHVFAALGPARAASCSETPRHSATAKTHVSRPLMKLQAHDHAHLVVIAYESGLVSAQPRPPN